MTQTIPFNGSRFRNPTNNARLLRALFWETNITDKSQVMYTLKRIDHLDYPSLYRLYIEMEDVTEWEFGNKYLEDYDHWLALCECDWFKPYIRQWRDELQRKLTARGLRIIKEEAAGGGRNALAAAKYLMERGWESKEDKKKLTQEAKEAVLREAEKLSREEEELAQAAERVGLTLVKG